MTTTLAPRSEEEFAAAGAAAARAREPLAIEGNGSKRALLRPVQAARTLSTRNLSGITLSRPTELIISAWAGTPMPEIEAALAEGGQHIPAEPPDTRAFFGTSLPATLGGIVAANLSGPRRITAGAIRDLVMGVRFVNGQGEVVRSGGRVLKNVTGLDLCKLLTGSHGTLGVITEVTLKVLPVPETTATLALSVPDLDAGVRALSAGLGSPYGVTGAAILPHGAPEAGLHGPTAILRIEDFASSVAYRTGRLADDLAGYGGVSVIEDTVSRPLWQSVRDLSALGATPDQAVWRLSVRPTLGPRAAILLQLAFGARLLLDWGGGLIWAAGPATQEAHEAVMRAAGEARGTFTLFRAPEPLRAAVNVIPPEPPALAAIGTRVKSAFDPAGVFNPGRMRAGL